MIDASSNYTKLFDFSTKTQNSEISEINFIKKIKTFFVLANECARLESAIANYRGTLKDIKFLINIKWRFTIISFKFA